MIAGRYELDHEIGRGGMGAVWLARDTTLGRDVAVKRIGMMPGGSTPDQDRAAREARLAARMNHTHVVQVFDLISEDDVQWLIMEYVQGRTLAELIRTEGALGHHRASTLVGQAADALAAAHAAGIVHRDVKPSNILVDSEDGVKLSDFGIAKAEADPSLTQTGLVTGSPAYLSPEVASGAAATTASDVWSLGATLFHALSGRPPYEVGENLLGALFRIVHDDPPRLPDAGWLAPLLDATMTKEPEERWSMEQVRDFLHTGGDDVATAAGSTQVMAAPPPATPPEPIPAAAEVPAEEGPGAAEAPSRRRGGGLPLAIAAALVVVLGVLAWTLLRGDDGTTPTIDRPSAGASGGDGGGGGAEPADGGSSSAAPKGPTAKGMKGFVTDYLATAPSSPETSFEMLTPAFKRASGGLEGYSGYWSTIATAEPLEIRADPDDLVVEYVVAYTRQDGSELTDDVELQLSYEDGRYLIADET